MIHYSWLFKKTVSCALIVALALAAFPLVSASASGATDPDNPPTDRPQLTGERLERMWVHMQRIYDRQGRILERADQMIDRFQNLIDRMEENGKDGTALQAALDAFEEALKEAHPVYESAKGIIHSHQGLDGDGKVTDPEKAIETIKDLSEKMREVRQIIGEPGRAFREALKAFRDANRPAGTSH